MCLTASAGSVGLESCLAAIAAGDGRELWAFQAGGQLLHLATKECAGVDSARAGAPIVMMPCDGAAAWELLANGQAQVGSLCLSQSGSAAGVDNAAAHAAAVATSTADAWAHGAAAAVDLDEASYWASKFDDVGPVELSIDLGSERRLEAMRVSWEFPAKAFAVLVSVDGERWSEVFATSVNIESTTTIDLEGRPASKVRLVMQEARPLHGAMGGHALYGVRSVSLRSPQLRAVVDDCATAGRATDARDKYFASFVSEFNPASSQALKGELPSLAAAKAALSAAVSEVMGRIPKASTCGPVPSLSEAVAETHASSILLRTGMASAGRALTRLGADSMDAAVADVVDLKYGLGADRMQQVLGPARSAIVRLRSLLR